LKESLIKSLKSAPILVAGDVMVDEYVVGDVERISPESPVPVLIVRERERRLGGAGNVVKNVVSLGGTVALFATIGDDPAGRWFRSRFEELSVETFWLREDPIRPTTMKTRVVARNQQMVRIDEEHVGSIPSSMEKVLAEEIGSVIPQVKSVVISDYGKGFLTPAILEALLSGARDNSLPVIVDPKGQDFSRYRGATYITPNRREASLASGVEMKDEDSLIHGGRILIEKTDAQGIIVTLGRDGSFLITRESAQAFPVNPVEMIDVTGAGDTVVAMLALALANGLPVEKAITLSNLAASIVVSRFGAATVTLQEMIDNLNDQKPTSKIVGSEEIGQITRTHRLRGHKVVFTNGCFDLLHPGHLKTLREASESGDILVVGMNSDYSVKQIKGPDRPILSESERAELVSALAFVDYVVLFDEETPIFLIEKVLPDVLVKGEDWRGKTVVGEELVTARGGKIVFVDHVKGMSTSELIKKIRG
jgi:D-beta-D-heptose 7-phosphate kinase/D-beta-D-heptose 1-phosphate adenosyltransferase